MALEVVYANAPQIALTITLVCGFVAFLKILVDPTSPFLKRRHLERIRYSLLLGVAMGLGFSFFAQYSQYYTLAVSFTLLAFTLYYYFLRRTPTIFYSLRLPWVSREKAQARFFHFSMATTMATFVIFFFWLGVFQVPSGIPVPLLTITLLVFSSAISAIFALTTFVPKLDMLFRLIDDYVQAAHHPREGMGVDLEDSDFHVMIADTAFTPAEVVDAFESLRSEGYAERQPKPVLGHARYRILPDGIIFLDAAAQDVKGRIDSAIRESNIAIDSIDSRVNGARALESPALKEAVKQLQTLGVRMMNLKEEYGRMLPSEWEASSSRRIHDLVTGIHEQLVGSLEGEDAREVLKEQEHEPILKELPQDEQVASRGDEEEEEETGREEEMEEEASATTDDTAETEGIQEPEETREEMHGERGIGDEPEEVTSQEEMPDYERTPLGEAPQAPSVGDSMEEETEEIQKPEETPAEEMRQVPPIGDGIEEMEGMPKPENPEEMQQQPAAGEDAKDTDDFRPPTDDWTRPGWRYRRKHHR